MLSLGLCYEIDNFAKNYIQETVVMKILLKNYIIAGFSGMAFASCTSIMSFTDSIFKKDRSPQIEVTAETDSIASQGIATVQIPYLKFKALETGSFSFSKAGLSYSLDGGSTWTILRAGASTLILSVGDSVMWKNNTEMSPSPSEGIGTFSSTGRFDASGNIMSLYYGKDCAEQKDLTGKDYAFSGLFTDCTGLVSAEALQLPATTLADYCYSNMFENCISLISAPVLPATSLAECCYSSMFEDCVSLVSAPALPAMTLKEGCYNSMFEGCRDLSLAPELPATTLAESCYSSMFEGCTSLIFAPSLPAITLTERCYSSMFSGCSCLASEPALPATTLANYCYSGMFYGCISLTTAPELPAVAMEKYCYSSMFSACTGLISAPMLPAMLLAESCYSGMFNNCTSLTEAPALPARILSKGCYEYMFYGCKGLTVAPELPATILAKDCYTSMFMNCNSLEYIKAAFTISPSMDYTNMWVYGVKPKGRFCKNYSANWKVKGTNGVPSGWKVVRSSRSTVSRNGNYKRNSYGKK